MMTLICYSSFSATIPTRVVLSENLTIAMTVARRAIQFSTGCPAIKLKSLLSLKLPTLSRGRVTSVIDALQCFMRYAGGVGFETDVSAMQG
jgi:hypothetical protein